MAVNLIYFGSPDFSAKILESILRGSELIGSSEPSAIRVVGVITNPDKPFGRKQILTPSPVAQVAIAHHIPTFKPVDLDDGNLAHLKLLSPDIFLTVAYGKIIPDIWLSAPKIKSLNLHFSLLPKHRGALCIQEALKNGDTQTGVTLMEMTNSLDAGPIISQSTINIELSDNVANLQTKLTQAGIDLLVQALPEYLDGTLTPKPQDPATVTYTPSLTTLNHQTAFIPWGRIHLATEGSVPPVTISTHNLIRSLNPEPGAWTTINGQELKILSTHLENNKLIIDIVQPSGKNPLTWKQFLSGHGL